MKIETISRDQYHEFLLGVPSASFLQLPEWGEVKREWKSRLLGIFDEEKLAAVALLLTRQLPFVNKSFGYVPEGPIFSLTHTHRGLILAELEEFAKKEGIFLLRIGPTIPFRDWENQVIKDALAHDGVTSLLSTPASIEYENGRIAIANFKKAGWRPVVSESGFSEGQPNFVFQVSLENKSEESLLAGFNQLWRRNIKRAEKEEVEIKKGQRTDLSDFHRVYVETAKRDHFTPRSQRYFEQMWDALGDRLTLFLASWQGNVIAAAISIQVGNHYWYSYGASSAIGREARGSNAVQWAMMQDALAKGATCYDLRGITPTLDPNDPHAGLIQFKVGTGGYARQFVGEWERPISAFWSLAFATYLRIRK